MDKSAKTNFQRTSALRKPIRGRHGSRITEKVSPSAICIIKSFEKSKIKYNKLFNLSSFKSAKKPKKMQNEETVVESMEDDYGDFNGWSDRQILMRNSFKIKKRSIFRRSKVSKHIKPLGNLCTKVGKLFN